MPQMGMLEGLLAFWNSMTIKQREALTKNLAELTALAGSLKNREIISGGVDTGKIIILKRNKEIKRLRQLVKLTGVKGITIENNRGKIAP